MIHQQGREGLAALLKARIKDDLDVFTEEVDTMAQYLSELTSIDILSANSLLWGEKVVLSAEDIDKVAFSFSLHRDLLACLIAPTSDEMVKEVFQEILTTGLNIEHCPTCQQLTDQLEGVSQMSEGEITLLAVEVLEHVVVAPEREDLEEDTEEDERANDLIRLYYSMPEASQFRLLAYAYQEMAGSSHDTTPARFASYAHLRGSYLTPLARDVFDQLALSEHGEMNLNDLANKLQLTNSRSLGQVPRSVLQSVGKLESDGHSVDPEILIVKRSGKSTTLALSADALVSWRALLQSEEHLSKVE